MRSLRDNLQQVHENKTTTLTRILEKSLKL